MNLQLLSNSGQVVFGFFYKVLPCDETFKFTFEYLYNDITITINNKK